MSRLWLALAIGLSGCAAESKCGDVAETCSPDGASLAKSSLARNAQPSAANVGVLTSGNRAFAFDLFHEVIREDPTQNVLLSPYSISTALAMTYAGARGSTESEMKQALHYTLDQAALHEAFNATDLALSARGEGKPGADRTPFRLNVDNSIWVQENHPVVPGFLDTLALNYGAGVHLANFERDPEAARQAINGWVDEKTEQLIPELLKPRAIDSLTRFVLTNTVYFNASWQTKFDPKATRPEVFTKLDGSTTTVDMMHGGFDLKYAQAADWQAVALPYLGGDLALIAILPTAGKFDEVAQTFDREAFDLLWRSLAPGHVVLSFPKLDFRFSIGLKPTLRALGMNAPFMEADFSGLTSGDVRIADVVHEAVIRVFEEGTVAAGATAVILAGRGTAPIVDHTVTLDRPFLFAIYDQPTATILFLGRVLAP
jgi:serpin B